MTEKKQEKTKDNAEKKKPAEFTKYAFANVASQLAQNEENPFYVKGALSLLEKNLDLGLDGIDLYKEYVDKKREDELIDIFNKKFSSKLEEASVSDIYSWYEPALNGATDEQKKLVKSEFDKFAGENYVKLMQKIKALQYNANPKAPEGAISKEQKEKAENELKPYSGFILAQNKMNEYNYENLRYQAVEASKKDSFGELEKILTEINKPKDSEKKAGKEGKK